jgi:hypothetical protein
VGWRGMEWIDMAQDRYSWRAVVYAVMSFRLHKMRGISWLAEELLASQSWLCCLELCHGCTNFRALNFVRWRLIFLGHQYVTCRI